MNSPVPGLLLAENRSAPGPTLANAVLISAAGLLAATGVVPVAGGIALAAAVTWAAAAVVTPTRARTLQILGANGTRRRTVLAIGLLRGFLPGLVAFPIVSLALALGNKPQFQPVLVLALVLTLVVPSVAAMLAAIGLKTNSAPARVDQPRWRRRLLVGSGLVLAAIPFVLVLPPLLVAVAVAAFAARRSVLTRLIVGVLLMVAATIVIGGISDWLSLALGLFLLGPVVAAGVAVVATAALDGATSLAGRGPLPCRLALAGLGRQRHLLMPLMAAVTVACAALSINGVLAASFGEREADRQNVTEGFQVTAGPIENTGLVVGQTRFADVDQMADAVANTNMPKAGTDQHTDIAIGVIDEILVDPPPEPADGQTAQTRALSSSIFGGGPAAGLGTSEGGSEVDPTPNAGPGWVGAIDPVDLIRLGLPDAAAILRSGRAVIFNDLIPDGPLTVSGRSAVVTLEGEQVTKHRIASSFPGVLVDPDTATMLGTTRPRVVAGTSTEHSESVPSWSSIKPVVDAVQNVMNGGLDAELRQTLTSSGVTLGQLHLTSPPVPASTSTDVARGGPLNDVPFFGTVPADGTRPLAPLALIVLIITLTAVAFMLDATRGEDEVLSLQGAPERLRAQIVAVQAAVIAGLGSVLGLLLGLAMALGAMEMFNRRNSGATMPDIPLIVPLLIPATLAMLPVVAAFAANLIVRLRRPASPADLADRLDGLI